MKIVKRSLLDRLKCFDPFLMLCTGGLTLISLLALWGGRGDFGSRAFLMQLAMSVVGVGMVIFIASLDYEHIVDKYYIVAFLGSVFLMAVTLLFGFSVGGNRSWLELPGGFSVQPSEFVKAAYIMTFAKHLSNLTLIVDYNQVQALGHSEEVIDLRDLRTKLEAFGWAVKVIDGHNINEIEAALSTVPYDNSMPSAIIAHTIKCKGIPELEDTVKSHYKYIADEDLERVIKGIEEA